MARGRLLTATAWVLVASQLVLLAAGRWAAGLPVAAELGDPLPLRISTGDLLLGPMYAVVGALVVTLRPVSLIGWVIALAGLAGSGSAGLQALAGPAVQSGWPAARWLAWASSPLWLVATGLLAGPLIALYPSGHLPGPRWRAPVRAYLVGLLLVCVAYAGGPGAYDDVAPGPSPWAFPAVASGGLMAVGGVLLLGGLAVVWSGTAVRLVRARPPERQQLAWLVAVVVPFVLTLFGPWDELGVGWVEQGLLVAVLGFPVAIAVGVFRYNLLGIEVVLRRGLVYGVLTAAILLVYAGVTALAGSTDAGPVPAVVAAVVVAVGMAPVRDRLQAAVDTFVYGDRADPMRAVTRLGEDVATADEPELLSAMLASVAGAVQAPGAEVVAVDGSVLGMTGTTLTAGAEVPLLAAGVAVGTLRVAARSPAEHFSRADRELLRSLAPQVAVAVRALELATSLEAARDRLLDATLQERDRIRRDLHDGLGPALAGLSLGLGALREALRKERPEVAADLVQRMEPEVRRAGLEVRRLIDGLRPAALDEAGELVGALRASALGWPGLDVRVQVHGRLPLLEPDVENCVYRVVTEALTNAARHASATECSVRLRGEGDGGLVVEIADDGCGIETSPPSAGLGLTSMRRRAAALGGRLDVDTGASGTTVRLALPRWTADRTALAAVVP